MRMKRKVVQKLMCAMLASSMLMTGFGVEAFASEDKNQQELSTEAPVTDEKLTYTIACQLSPNWGNPAEGENKRSHRMGNLSGIRSNGEI